ncbi:hypothetical protein [Agromyces salentinus]|uniref:Uncharacterized protein n=1 Tax=Agromyces salentinus TaxID=269421 RepID=A0ABP4Z3S4_9MICO|nr:hypothetical protein [Agromyces salentinus]
MSTDGDQHETEPDRQIARLLHRAAPQITPKDDALAARMAEMAAAAIREERGAQRRKQGIAAGILAPVLLLGSAGAAYAATTVDWSSFWGASTTTEWADWAQRPDATITYTLPGGGSCELRLGEFEYNPDPNGPTDVGTEPRAVDASLDYVHGADVLADADVDGVIRENRSDENWADDGSGNAVRFGFGTENVNADMEYNLAVREAVHEAIIAHLDMLGIPSTGLGFQSQEQCTGMTQ